MSTTETDSQRAPNEAFALKLREEKDYIPENQFEMLERKHGRGTLEMAEALVVEDVLNHTEVCRIWGDSVNCAYVDLLKTVVTNEALGKLPVQIARKAQALPLYVINDVLTVAVSTPEDTALLRRLEGISGMPVSPVFALPTEVRDSIEVYYSSDKDVTAILSELSESGKLLLNQFSNEEIMELSESKSLIRVVDALIYFAMRERASDIHIEPRADETVVRFRVDGRMREMLRFSKTLHKAIICRIKIVSDLNIAESRLPHDGRFSMPVGPRTADFRVSIIPTVHGEKTVIRILASANKAELLNLDKMLISRTVLDPFRETIRSPNGIIFVTGPTGSGKTTTLYAALQEIKNATTNIVTIEDPVEMKMDGLSQSQVNSSIDLSFADLLRSMLRQDPDVILVGEIRDLETAKIACEAALTGHLVFATLHTNNAIQAVLRLVEIGIEPHMVAPAIQAVLAQRLAARICDRCKESYRVGDDVLSRYFHDAEGKEMSLYVGRGCNTCRKSGYSGRVALHELAIVTEEMRALIGANRPSHELTQAAKRGGYRPLRYDGLKKALLGVTTLEEIEHVTSFEWAV
ncbi:MAG: GspE/PulE family protein [Opitutales bacterium]